ncbi:hypothetical protein DF268_11130 [Streptomyces sp. V2]|uniref:hypothetical protein n=1 Tax=Streptomyces TaxID=1883 RepID=UPI0006EB508A|nr:MULTISPECIES: hypothetical protein [Streptomyces]PWG13498.1 hypothetical protein DF268_11130 [Streptomyces sp. V2]
MICPHCRQSLLRKERPGNRCGKCGRRYAFDPKTDPLELNDLRVLRIAAALTSGGQLPCTTGQLWYALSRRSLRRPRAGAGCAIPLAVLGGGVGIVGVGSGVGAAQVVGLLALLVAAGFGVAHVTGVGRGRPRLERASFRTVSLAAWRVAHGSLPPGILDDTRAPLPREGAASRTVVLCPDRSIAVFLDAAGLDVVTEPSALPRRVPVLVLHDADAAGVLYAHWARSAYPGRIVVDVGVPVDAVYGVRKAVPVRGERPDADTVKSLTATGELTAQQVKWLARGWGFPLVGVPPAKLLAAVTRAREQVEARREAAAVGFLTWPETPRTGPGGPG